MSDLAHAARQPRSTEEEPGKLPGARNEAVAIERPNLWEQQPWESDLAYHRFAQFYLSQQQPRSVIEAYRRFRKSAGWTETKIAEIRTVPGSWNRWAYATDKRGSPLPGTRSWAERAGAWDQHLTALSFQEQEETWRERRRRIREHEFSIGEKLMRRCERMQAKPLFDREEHKLVTIGDQQIPQQIIYRSGDWSERDIASAAKVASDLMRRSADMPVGKMEADWRKELMQQFPGLDPDEIQKAISDALSNVIADLLARRNHTA